MPTSPFRPHCALGNGARRGTGQRGVDRLRCNWAIANGVQATVICFADDGIDRGDAFHSWLCDELRDECVGRAPDAQGTGEQDWRFEFAEFLDLGGAHELAEGVADVDGCGNAIEEEIAGVRQDGRDARMDGVAADDGGVADFHAVDIGDGVVRAWRKDAGCHAEVTGTDAGLCGDGWGQCGGEENDCGSAHP